MALISTDIMDSRAIRRLHLWWAQRRPIDWDCICHEASAHMGITLSNVMSLRQSFTSNSENAKYGDMLDAKTLSDEEAFIVYITLYLHKPRVIVEIGTQHGRSTRRIIDMCGWLGLRPQIYCFDIADSVRFFRKEEATLIVKDVTNSFERDVLGSLSPEFIFLDARPYHLLRNVIASCMDWATPFPLAIHDCGRHLSTRTMKLSKDSFDISSATGVWERHVLAELFHVNGALSRDLDSASSESHLLRIFPTRHGLALLEPRECLM